jgi:hypothetical protein
MKFFLIGCITTLALITTRFYGFLDLGFSNFQADQSPFGFTSITSRDSFAPTRLRRFPFGRALYTLPPLSAGHAKSYSACKSGICYTYQFLSQSLAIRAA